MDWSSIVEGEGGLLIEAARLAPDAQVPACEGFDVRRLVRHLAFVHARTVVGLAGTVETPFRRDDALPPPGAVDEALDRYPAALAGLVEAMRTADPATPTWTMTDPEGVAAFWLRRAGHETTVHRADVQQAAGVTVAPVPADRAVDGVGELLDLSRAGWSGSADGPSTVHLHATDIDGEWLVSLGPDGLTVETGHAKGDAAVRGPAGDLYLWLWGRLPLDGLEVFGDAAVVARLREAVIR